MIEITAETLKWAYLKLKNYVYYASPASYLKDKIIAFERKYKENTFHEMAQNLDKILAKGHSMISRQNVSYTIYPKKDGVSDENDKVLIEDYNIFIDMPLKFYLLDILFTLNIFENMDSSMSKYSFGNDFNSVLWKMKERNGRSDILENRLLFANFNTQYDNWKKKIYKYLEENPENDYYILKMDFKKSYYNVYFNIRKFIETFVNDSVLNDPVYEFECELYSYYTTILASLIPQGGSNNQTNFVHLPIGLFSSACIYNILLENFDKYMLSNTLVYSRYVDDILIVLPKKTKNNISNIFDVFFPGVFESDQDGEFYVKDLLDGKGRYVINKNKMKVVAYKKGYNLAKVKRHLNKIIRPSLDVIEEMDFEEGTFDESDLYKHDYLRSVINKLNSEEDVAQFDFLKNISDAELINIFSAWKLLLISKSNCDFFKPRIEEALQKIQLKAEDKPRALTKLKRALRKELGFAVDNKEYKKYLLCDISQERIFKHIKKVRDGEEDVFYPLNVTFDEVTIFLSHDYKNIGEQFLTEAESLYKQANNLSIQKNCNIICGEQNVFYLQPNQFDFESERNNIRVAVANINLSREELEETDIEGKFPLSYSLRDFVHIIDLAKNLAAEMIIFPEFALPEQYSLDIVKHCKKVGISIVTGLTHKIMNGKLVNYILIRDKDLDLAVYKWKNYMPYQEKEFCFKNHFGFLEPENPYYFIFDNGNYKYSTMTCFEVTSIHDRALLCDKIEVLYVPVFNPDTFYFSNIIASFVRDASCFVAQANANQYGDSRISGPFGQIDIDIAKLKGGLNNYFVIGNINLGLVREKNEKGEELEAGFNFNDSFELYNIKEIDNEFKAFKSASAKPLSAGYNRYKIRKENGLK